MVSLFHPGAHSALASVSPRTAGLSELGGDAQLPAGDVPPRTRDEGKGASSADRLGQNPGEVKGI